MAQTKYNYLKDRLVSRAAVMMSQCGFEAFTVKALADRVGMKPSGVLYYFKNKSEIFTSIVLKVVGEGRDLVELRLKQNAERGFAELKIWIDAHYDWLEQAPYRQALMLTFYTQSLRNPELKKMNAEIARIGRLRVRDIIDRARADKTFKKLDLDSLAEKLHALLSSQLISYCSQNLEGRNPYDRQNTFRLVYSIISADSPVEISA